MIAFGLEASTALRLDTRQFQLLRKNLRKFLHREVDFEDVSAGSIAGLALAVFVYVARREGCSRFAFTLSDTACVAASEAEARHLDLRDRNADKILPLFADQFSLRDVLLQVLLDLAPDDLPESQVVLFDIENHMSVGAALSCGCALSLALRPVTPSHRRGQKCSRRNSARRSHKRRNTHSS